MFRSLTVLLVVTIVGCTSSQQSAASRASGSPVESSGTPAASTRPTSEGAQTPSPTQAQTLSCKIPFVASDQRVYSTGEGTAGFLQLPDGTFSVDPSGVLTQGSSGQYTIGKAPVLPGAFFTGYRSWDEPASRWVPVPPQQTAPNGTSYVYQVGPEIHIVTIATGKDTVIYRQPSGFPPANWAGPQLLAYVGGSVYISVNSTYKGQGGSLQSVPADQVGVWRVDLSGGAPQRVLASAVDGIITSDGYTVWTIENDSASPPTGTLVRYDLASAQKSAWFSLPGSGMDALGVDSNGRPIVWTYDYQGNLKIWLVSAPNAAITIDSVTYAGNVPFYAGNNNEFGPLEFDSHGVWLGSTTGVLLYDHSGLHKVAEAAGIPVGACT